MGRRVDIDGRLGEGGGQIVRTALQLALLSGKPVRLTHIRDNRPNAGLRAHHVRTVRSAATIAPGSVVEGDEVGSDALLFAPAAVRSGHYKLDAGPEGGVGLLLQTLALPLACAGGRSQLRIRGGTHLVNSPSFEFLDHIWSQWMGAIGVRVDLSLVQSGFYPRGRGEISATIHPLEAAISPISQVARGRPRRIRLMSLQTSNLPRGTERKRLKAAANELRKRPKLIGPLTDIEQIEGQLDFTGSSGTQVFVVLDLEGLPAGFQDVTARRDKIKGATESTKGLLRFLESGAAVDPHTGDQLLVALALAAGPSELTTPTCTPHMQTQMHVISSFLGARFEVSGDRPTTIGVVPSSRQHNGEPHPSAS